MIPLPSARILLDFGGSPSGIELDYPNGPTVRIDDSVMDISTFFRPAERPEVVITIKVDDLRTVPRSDP